MRPAGEIRRALLTAAYTLVAERGEAVTWRDLAQQACIGYGVARRTVDNMSRSGDLLTTGTVRVPGSRRPMTAYLPTAPQPPILRKQPPLDRLMCAWVH